MPGTRPGKTGRGERAEHTQWRSTAHFFVLPESFTASKVWNSTL
jgi:hypothetical protein